MGDAMEVDSGASECIEPRVALQNLLETCDALRKACGLMLHNKQEKVSVPHNVTLSFAEQHFKNESVNVESAASVTALWARLKSLNRQVQVGVEQNKILLARERNSLDATHLKVDALDAYS